MYRIKVINVKTGITFYEYGFANYMMKRLHFMNNEKDYNFYCIYEILDIVMLNFTIKTFIKCLTNYSTVI